MEAPLYHDVIVFVTKKAADADQYHFSIGVDIPYPDMNARKCYVMLESFYLLHSQLANAAPTFLTDSIAVSLSGVKHVYDNTNRLSSCIAIVPVDSSVVNGALLSKSRYQSKSFQWFETQPNPFVQQVRLRVSKADFSPIPEAADEICMSFRFRFF
jgi:hypothetical protein